MKNYNQLIAGVVIGSVLTGSLAFAGNLRTFTAEEADFPVMVNGSPISLDMPVVTIQDRTYLPLRAMGNVLGVKVDWNEEKAQAEVTTDATPAPTSTTTPVPTPTSTLAPDATPVPTATATSRPAETPDGLEIYYFDGVGYIDGPAAIRNMSKKINRTFLYTGTKIVDVENEYQTVISDIPQTEDHPTYIPVDFYVNTILPYINTQIQ